MMRMEHRLVQTQSQRLMLTQKMQQALQVLQLSGLELQDYVQQELESNPVLDQQQQEAEVTPPTTTEETQPDQDNYDDQSFDLDDFASKWDQRLKEGRDFSANSDMAKRREYFENSITEEKSLSAHLLDQLRLAAADETELSIGEHIIGEFNDRGYFTGVLEEIALELGEPLASVERMLYRIQRFEPTGVGARDVTECLLLQMNVAYPDNTELRTLVADHLDDLTHRQILKIAKAMHIAPDRVEELRELLSTLDPWPGHEFSAEPTQFVAPDLIVEKLEGEWVVRLTGDSIPDLQINGHYKNLVKQRGTAKDEKKYLRDKLESAKWLIRNIEQRQDTILRIGRAIMDVQSEFIEKGVKVIKPLTLQEIADMVGVHEATVSRTTRGKYIQTPQGLYELKFFFSPGLQNSNGSAKSSKSVQLQIKKLIDNENTSKPLSDQAIADMLKEEGLTIARRTVTKYRKTMNIPSTTMRRRY